MSHIAVQQMLDRALEHHRAGGLAQAEPLYQDALAISPNHPDALYLLGALNYQKGHLEYAIKLTRAAIAGCPKSATYRYALAQMLTSAREKSLAIASYREAIRLKPDFALAWNNLGMLLDEHGDSVAAGDAYHHAIEAHDDFPECHNNLGGWHRARGHLDHAIMQFQKAIALRRDFPAAHFNLGQTFAAAGQFEQAATELRIAVEQQPDFPQALTALGNVLHELRQVDRSIEAYEQGIALDPGLGTPYYNLGISYLLKGDLARGWEGFESRRCVREFMPFCRNFAQPMWDGSDLAGRSILLHAEQGFGDTIQFVRLVSQVRDRGAGQIILLVQPELRALIGSMPGIDLTISEEEVLPPFDVHCPLPGLPFRLKIGLETIPSRVPYLRASMAKIEQFKRILAGNEKRIGLVWAGRREHQNDSRRSIAIAKWAPLAEVHGIHWISLQKGHAARDAMVAPMPMVDLTSELHDFSDTAGLIANLDLIITVDTAVAHLAGAMGKAVWVLLPYVPDWRWMLDREDSPWYPSMRLFRQPKPDDWATPIDQIAGHLAHFAEPAIVT